MKEGNTFSRRHVPGSTYRKKMALVTSLTQHWQWLSSTEVWRMNIHLPSPRLSVLQMVVHEKSRCRPLGLCEISTGQVLVTVLSCSYHVGWPAGLRDTCSPSDFNKPSFWVPLWTFFQKIIYYKFNGPVSWDKTSPILLSVLRIIFTPQSQNKPALHCSSWRYTVIVFTQGQKNYSTRGFAHFKIWNLISSIDYLLISDCIMPMWILLL